MDEGGMSRVPVHLRMLSGGAGSELPKRPAVVLKDCAWGRAMGNSLRRLLQAASSQIAPHLLCSRQGERKQREKTSLRRFSKAGVRVLGCQVGNLYAGHRFSLNTILFSSQSLLSLPRYL